MAGWDPFLVLCLDHDPHLRDLVVRRAYRVRLRRVWRVRGEYERAAEAMRVKAAYRAVRTASQRCQMLTDMAVQPDAWRGFWIHPDVMAMADAVLPALPPGGGDLGLVEVCDLRALVREAAALRLERAASGVAGWPRTRAGRVWWRVRYGRPG